MTAVIFDFSGTLFRAQDPRAWLAGTLASAGIDADPDQVRRYAERLAGSGGQPGGYPGEQEIPGPLRPLWERRDLDPDAHRAVYTELIRSAGLPWPGIEERLYDRHWLAEAWLPYPDTRAVLETLRDRGIPAAVLSNIPVGVRHVFGHRGLDPLLAGYVFSFAEGVRKPDPEIFRRACALLGQDPADVTMVGDSVADDGAATAIGCRFRHVPHLPVTERPRALLDAVTR